MVRFGIGSVLLRDGVATAQVVREFWLRSASDGLVEFVVGWVTLGRNGKILIGIMTNRVYVV